MVGRGDRYKRRWKQNWWVSMKRTKWARSEWHGEEWPRWKTCTSVYGDTGREVA